MMNYKVCINFIYTLTKFIRLKLYTTNLPKKLMRHCFTYSLVKSMPMNHLLTTSLIFSCCYCCFFLRQVDLLYLIKLYIFLHLYKDLFLFYIQISINLINSKISPLFNYYKYEILPETLPKLLKYIMPQHLMYIIKNSKILISDTNKLHTFVLAHNFTIKYSFEYNYNLQ